jgi:hypothetical protein
MNNVVAVRSEPAVAGVLGKGGAHRSGLDLGLELGDQPGVPLKFPVHRVLQALDQLLDVRQSRFECLELFRPWLAGVVSRSIARRGETADLADPCNQSLAVAHGHRRPRGFD